MTGRKKFECKVSALFLFHRQLLSDTDMSLSETAFIVKTTLIIQVISSNLPLPAEWNYAEEKHVKEQCQKFREEILKIDRTFYFTESWKMIARGT